jgi:hypothetical protein
MAYATLSELKLFIRMPEEETADDDLLGIALTAASEAIDVSCNTTFPRPLIAADEDTGAPELPADAAVPDGIVMACLLQSSRWYKRRDAPFGIAGSDSLNVSIRLAKVDPDVAVLLSTYRRRWGAV